MVEYEQCRYTHEISDADRDVEIFEHTDADEWSCHHPADDDSTYCLFHKPVEDKDDQAVVKEFQEVVNSGYESIDIPPQERLRFIGAQFGDFSLPLFTTLAISGGLDPAAGEYPIDLREVRIDGALHWSRTTIRHGLLFDGTVVTGEVGFAETTIEGECSFVAAEFASPVRFDEAEIAGALSFVDAQFDVAISIAAADIDDTVTFEDCRILAAEEGDEWVKLHGCGSGDLHAAGSHVAGSILGRNAVITGTVRGTESAVNESVVFDEAEIEGAVEFEAAEIGHSAEFNSAEVGSWVEFGDAVIKESAEFRRATIEGSARFDSVDIGGAAKFEEATLAKLAANQAAIGKSMRFEDAYIGTWARVNDTTIGGSVEFDTATVEDFIEFKKADVSRSLEFNEADVGTAKFTAASVGDSAEFEAAAISGKVRFNDADIGYAARFEEVTIEESAAFKRVDIAESAEFTDANIEGTVSFEASRIGKSAAFEAATIEGRAIFDESEIGGSATFIAATIGNSVTFGDTDIEFKARFNEVTIRGSARFEAADIGMSVEFEAATIDGKVQFAEAVIDGWAKFEAVDIGRAAEFQDAEITKSARFERSTIGHEAKFNDTSIDESAEFENADIGRAAEFERADIGWRAEFDDAAIGQWAQFNDATVGRAAQFNGVTVERFATFDRADIGGPAEFTDADADSVRLDEATIGESVDFRDATPGIVSLENASFADDVTLAGNFGENPSLTGLKVAGTLRLDLAAGTDSPTVVDVSNTTADSISVTDDARSLVLDLSHASIGHFDDRQLPDIRVINRWSLSRLDFDSFDFTESRGTLNRFDWNVHTLDAEARNALARDAVRDRVSDLTRTFTDLLTCVPELARRLVDGDLAVVDDAALIAGVADIVFADEATISGLVDGKFDDVDVTEDPAIRYSETSDTWTYTIDAALAVQDLCEELHADSKLIDAIASDTVADRLETIARQVVDSEPEAGPDVEVTPEAQVDTDALVTDDLQAALYTAYADPNEFRADHNPETWEATYRDAKKAASDQGLNDTAAELFLREKRFSRKRHAQAVQSSDSMAARATAAFDWISNATMDVTTGYGERPRNVIVSSLVIVGLFAGLYRVLGALPDKNSPAEYILFSLQNFVTFIIGTQPQGTLSVRYASAVEAFFGAFLVALFVFTLTRSLNR